MSRSSRKAGRKLRRPNVVSQGSGSRLAYAAHLHLLPSMELHVQLTTIVYCVLYPTRIRCSRRSSRLQIIALFLESMLFGAFSILYGIAIWILLYREKRRSKSRLNKMLFGTSTAMWVLSVAVRCVPSLSLLVLPLPITYYSYEYATTALSCRHTKSDRRIRGKRRDTGRNNNVLQHNQLTDRGREGCYLHHYDPHR